MRRAEPADAAAVAALVERAYGHYEEEIGVRPGPMDADYAREIAVNEGWVTPADGDLQGVLILRLEPDHVFVENVAVEPEAQGRGIARGLLDLAEGRARELGHDELRLLTHSRMRDNRSLYEHLGWELTDQRDDEGFDRVFFRKGVAPDRG